MTHQLKVLLVDQEDDTTLIRDLLSSVPKFEFQLDCAENLGQALTKLQSDKYDAVVANAEFSIVKGIELVKTLKKTAPDMPLVIVSGAIDDKSISWGADECLVRDAIDGNRLALAILYARQKRKKNSSKSADFEVWLDELEAKIIETIVVKSVSLKDALTELLIALENYQNNSYRASILLLRDDRLYLGAAPNLPSAYNEATEGITIGNGVGSCGTAAFFRQTIYTVDIETDPLWANWRMAARKFGLKACWSVPIIDSEDKLHGTFGLYYSDTRFPSGKERAFIHAAAKTAAKILQRCAVLQH